MTETTLTPRASLTRRSIETLTDFRAARDEYTALVEGSERPMSPFVTHRWLSAWWEAFEKRYQVRVLCLYDGGMLVAAVPVMFGKDVIAKIALKRASFLGGDWGWNEVAVRPQAMVLWAEELLAWLYGEQSTRWTFFQAGPLRTDDPCTAELRRRLEARGIPYKTVEKAGPYLPVTGTWEQWLSGKSRNFRRTVKRKAAAAAEAGITVRCITSPSPEDMRATVFDVSRRSWQGAEGKAVASNDAGRHFYELLVAGHGELALDLVTAFHGDRCVAYLLGVRQGRVYHAFDTGFDPAYAEQSPGLLVHFATMERQVGAGVTEFNFGLEHQYKERFEPEHHPAVNLLFFRTRLAAALAALVDRAKKVLHRHDVQPIGENPL